LAALVEIRDFEDKPYTRSFFLEACVLVAIAVGFWVVDGLQ
jgi:hypothetical protein